MITVCKSVIIFDDLCLAVPTRAYVNKTNLLVTVILLNIINTEDDRLIEYD